MLDPRTWAAADLPPGHPPLLVVVVDTEEEFDWGRPLARENTGVTAMRHQERAHRIFDRYGVTPTYVIDYPVASQVDGFRPLAELLADGKCRIGAHLHPWVNPPYEEDVTPANSYPGNLPPGLEREKLVRLTGTIEDNLGLTPTIYKAGRYGVGPETTRILQDLGYRIDTSIVPETDFGADGGPDFRGIGARPYWFGSGRRLLEIPLTAGLAGLLGDRGRPLYEAISSGAGERFRLPGLFARLRLVERIRLTPEGVTYAEQRRLTEALLRTGHRVFCLAYHSPSLAPGQTPYVRNDGDLGAFLDRLDRYFEYFIAGLGGRPATPDEVETLVGPPPDTKAPQFDGLCNLKVIPSQSV